MSSSTESVSRSQSELNSWLVEEMYEQYQEDPSALSKSWRDFFADYRPDGGDSSSASRAREAKAEAEADPPGAGAAQGGGAGLRGRSRAERIRGAGARIVENMETSLGVPTATSVRDVPAKLLEVNRKIVNNYLRRTRGGKVSFTHLIAYAMVKAADHVPAMKNTYTEDEDGKPAVLRHDDFGLGLAVDVENDDGSRSLLVPVLQDVQALPFDEFLRAYEEVIRKIRTKKLDPAMFSGGVITITNPGTIGTVHSIPRLMSGQSAILGVGSIDYPPGYQAADPRIIAKLGISKVITLTSTYDHRVIQGAESGMFLKRVHELLLGDHGFYDEVFTALGHALRAGPVARGLLGVRQRDRPAHQADAGRPAVQHVPGPRAPDRRPRPAAPDPAVDAPRARPHLLRAVDLGPRPRVHDRHRRQGAAHAAGRRARRAARRLLPHHRHRVRPRARPGAEDLDPRAGRGRRRDRRRPRTSSGSSSGSTPPRPSSPSCTPSTWGRSASASRARSR
jgi:pyruvate/2-oxoglutarate dehydrogenase complex dihydrolipoamide acyltransferase (E2) component